MPNFCHPFFRVLIRDKNVRYTKTSLGSFLINALAKVVWICYLKFQSWNSSPAGLVSNEDLQNALKKLEETVKADQAANQIEKIKLESTISNLQHDLESLKHDLGPNLTYLGLVQHEVESIHNDLKSVEHDLTHDLESVQHELESLKHDLGPNLTYLGSVQHEVESIHHDLKSVEHDLGPNRTYLGSVQHEVEEIHHDLEHGNMICQVFNLGAQN